jgi:RNA ligase
MDLDELIAQGYITKRKHPEEDLFILNYTSKTQYERVWNEFTEQCRGLIVDSSMTIRSRCFRKFFNYDEVSSQVNKRISDGVKFDVFEKMDGSLGILYWIKDKPFIATRGSFESDQAIKATQGADGTLGSS